MPNKYCYGKTFEEKREEEDRQVYNDCLRSIGDYFECANWIQEKILDALDDMSPEEIKTLVKSNLIIPVTRR